MSTINLKRRPTFRTKSATSGRSVVDVAMAGETASRANTVRFAKATTAAVTTTNTTKPTTSSKKRKITKGIAIGLSRLADEETTVGLMTEDALALTSAATSESTTALGPALATAYKEPVIPEAQPGDLRLSAFCSKFRSKRKSKDSAATTNATPHTQTLNANFSEDAANSSATAGPVVQIVNGEIVLQESSLLVPGARRSVQEVEEEFQQVIEDETPMAVVGASYNSFSTAANGNNNSRAPQHWTVDDTKLFYDALRQVGTDFCTMASYFPHRNRKQLKRKYQLESTKNPQLIELALDPKAHKEIDLSVFKVNTASIIETLNATAAAMASKAAAQETAKAKDTRTAAEQTSATAKLDNTTSETPAALTTMSTSTTKERSDIGRPADFTPTWLDNDDDASLFPESDMLEDEFREESLIAALPSAAGDNDDDDNKAATKEPLSLVPTVTTITGAIGKVAKPKRPKFKALARSKPRAK